MSAPTNPGEMITPETNGQLQGAAWNYSVELSRSRLYGGRSAMFDDVDGFARTYLEAPDERFSTRFTPTVVGRLVGGDYVARGVESLTVSTDDSQGEWRFTLSVAMGRGAEPAVIRSATHYQWYDESDARRTSAGDEISWMLTETEGLALALDLHGAAERVAGKRRRFFDLLSLAKAKVLR